MSGDAVVRELVNRLRSPKAGLGAEKLNFMHFQPFLAGLYEGSVPGSACNTIADFLESGQAAKVSEEAVQKILGPAIRSRFETVFQHVGIVSGTMLSIYAKGGGPMLTYHYAGMDGLISYLLSNSRDDLYPYALQRLLLVVQMGMCVGCGREQRMYVTSFGRRDDLPRKVWPGAGRALCRNCPHMCTECGYNIAMVPTLSDSMMEHVETLRATGECPDCSATNPVRMAPPKANPKEMQRLRQGFRGLKEEK